MYCSLSKVSFAVRLFLVTTYKPTQLSQLRRNCCYPSLIIDIADPCMCVPGAVYLENTVVQPLTDFLYLTNRPQQAQRLAHLTRAFHALSVSISELQMYYASLSCLHSTHNKNTVQFTHRGRLNSETTIRPAFGPLHHRQVCRKIQCRSAYTDSICRPSAQAPV
jgi:hypothetical protein